MKHIVFTVTNDLSYDQRMQRICSSLAVNGFKVSLVGRKLKTSIDLQPRTFHQKRLFCFFKTGFLFYAEYNVRLLAWLMFQPIDGICAIDLDTIIPCYLVSVLRGKKRVYDAHELFSEQKEIIRRPVIHRFWLGIENFAVRRFQAGYTVSDFIREEFKKRYQVEYSVIRNLPEKTRLPVEVKKERIILYQGAVNEARGLENLVQAMKQVDATLLIYGDGNIYSRINLLVKNLHLEHKVFLKGMLPPDQLLHETPKARIGVNLVEPTGLNQLYSLANKFFDYIQAALPQITMNFPEYRKVNQQFEVALLLESVSTAEISEKLNQLMFDTVLYDKLQSNCLQAREVLHWQNEEKKLVRFYTDLFEA